MRALSCAISLQAAANSLFNILYAVCASYWAAQLQANLGSPGLAKIFVDWEHPTGTRRGDVDGTVRNRLRVIRGHTVIYHAPNHPIPKSMSPFLYRKLPKVNRSPSPWGEDDINRDQMSSLSPL